MNMTFADYIEVLVTIDANEAAKCYEKYSALVIANPTKAYNALQRRIAKLVNAR